jgi:hypothetical protein
MPPRSMGTHGNSKILGDALPEVLGRLKHVNSALWLTLRAEAATAQRLGYVSIDGHEAEWAYKTVLTGLNKKLHSIADRYGWTFVDRHVKLAKQHGYCSRDPWVRTWTEAKRLQEATAAGVGPSPGAVHPNQAGHFAYFEAINSALGTLGVGAP